MKENIRSTQMGKTNYKISVVIILLFSTLSLSNATIFEQYSKKFKNRNDILGDLAKIYDQFNQIANPDQSLSEFSDMHGEKIQDHSIKLQHAGHDDSAETVNNVVNLETITEPVFIEDIYKNEEHSENLHIEKVEDSVFASNRKHDHLSFDPKSKDNRTPIWGILTQPLKGDLISNNGENENQYLEFVPAAHVKFIEQTGAKVVPVSYRLEKGSMYNLLNHLNGLYIPGDTQELLDDHMYQLTIGEIITYMKQIADDIDGYFPVFMMGNSLQSYLANRVSANPMTKPMPFNQNLELRLVRNTDKTYIFDEINSEDEVEDFIENTKVFNRQQLGLRVREFKKESRINKRFNVVATFKDPITPYDSHSIVNEDEFIAILESPDFPLYFVTYDIQLTQFAHANSALNSKDPIDHSKNSRQHAQYIARQIIDEGKICQHAFKHQAEIFPRLINHRKLANVVYSNIEGVSQMPKGLETHELYLIGQKK